MKKNIVLEIEKKIEKSNHKIEELKLRINELRGEIKEFIKRQYIFCLSCQKNSRFGSWIFIQERYYVPPRSCNDGDYWNNSEVDVCDLICPKCISNSYVYNHPNKDKIVYAVRKLCFTPREVFGEVRESKRTQL